MQSFNLNMDRPGEYVLYAKQGDSNSRFVRLALSSGGVAYVPPVGSSMTIRYGAPNMPKGWYDTIELEDGTTRPAVTQNGNVVTLELAPQLLAVPGENRVCFLFHGAEDYQLGSWNFKLLIEGDPNPDAVQSEEYINISASTLSKVAEVAAAIAAANQALAAHVGDKTNPHAVTAAQVGAAPMAYAKKVGAPHNLLDNSDFKNPVLYNGVTSGNVGAWGGQTISKWFAISMGANFVSYPDSLGMKGGIYQLIDNPQRYSGKKLTFAAKIYGQIFCCSGTVTFNNAWAKIARYEANQMHIEINVQDNNDLWVIIENSTSGNETYLEWAALYEGEYTAETLPEYQPKEHSVEAMNCAEMQTGIVYITGEWYKDKPVYVKAVSLDLSTGTGVKTVEVEYGMTEVKTWSAYVLEDGYLATDLAFAGLVSAWVNTISGSVQVNSGAENKTVYAVVEYIK